MNDAGSKHCRYESLGAASSGIRFVLGFVAATALGCNRTLDTGEVNQLIDHRLADRGIAALPSSSSPTDKHDAPANPNTSPVDRVTASMALLASLDELMKDYKPTLPVVADRTDVFRCVTTSTTNSNEAIRKAKATLKKQLEASRKERRRKERDFYDQAYPIAFHFDLDWKSRMTAAVDPVSSCFINGFGFADNYRPFGGMPLPLTKGNCADARGTWKVRIHGEPPVYRYSKSPDIAPTAPPEMMSRMETAGVQLPARFSCRIDDVESNNERHNINCDATGGVAIRLSGTAPNLNVGDVVSVPLAGMKRDPDGVLFKSKNVWWVDADAASLRVDAAAVCPAIDEIVAAATPDTVPPGNQ